MAEEKNVSFTLLIQGGLIWLTTTVWADTMKKIINSYYPYGKESNTAHIIYAILVTIFVIIVVWSLRELSTKAPKVLPKVLPKNNNKKKQKKNRYYS